MPYKDPIRKKLYSIEHYLNNKGSYAVNRRRRRARIHSELDKIKMSSGCVDCGYREDADALEFDHRDPTLKVAAVAALAAGASKTLWTEVAKCDVRCANCHAIRTAKQRRSNSVQ